MNRSPADPDSRPPGPVSLGELLGGTDEEFVRAAYGQLLGRQPDAEGYWNCLEELRSGVSRTQVLATIATSAESAARSTARGGSGDLVMAIEAAQRAMTPPVATSYEELLGHADERFVRCAYLTVLGREADPQGLGHYRGQVREGVSKARILARLYESPEGRERERERRRAGRGDAPEDSARAGTLSRVAKAARRIRWQGVPVVGHLLGRLLGWERDDDEARALRRIENMLALLVEDRMETRIARHGASAQAEGNEGDGARATARPAAGAAAMLRTLPPLWTRRPDRAPGAAA